MAALTCDICGGSLSMDSSGDFAVCDSCGMKHTKERMQTKAQEITGTVKVSNQAGIESLMKRGYLALEDSKWAEGDGYFDKVLDIDPEYAPAYVGKLCIRISESAWLVKNDLFTDVVKKEADLARYYKTLDDMPDYQKAIRFADEAYRAQLEGYNNEIKKRIAELKNKYSFFMIIGKTELCNIYGNEIRAHVCVIKEPICYVGSLARGVKFKILRTGRHYEVARYEGYDSWHDGVLAYYDDNKNDAPCAGDIAVFSFSMEEERIKAEEDRKERERKKAEVEVLFQKGRTAYEEGGQFQFLFSSKKKYQEAADFFRQVLEVEPYHAGAREYLDRLKK